MKEFNQKCLHQEKVLHPEPKGKIRPRILDGYPSVRSEENKR